MVPWLVLAATLLFAWSSFGPRPKVERPPPPAWLWKLIRASAIERSFGANCRSNAVVVCERFSLSATKICAEPTLMLSSATSTSGDWRRIAAARSVTASVCWSVVPGTICTCTWLMPRSSSGWNVFGNAMNSTIVSANAATPTASVSLR